MLASTVGGKTKGASVNMSLLGTDSSVFIGFDPLTGRLYPNKRGKANKLAYLVENYRSPFLPVAALVLQIISYQTSKHYIKKM